MKRRGLNVDKPFAFKKKETSDNNKLNTRKVSNNKMQKKYSIDD